MKIRDLIESLDLSKKYYINKKVTRIALGSIMLLFIIALLIDGSSVLYNHTYIYCPEESLEPCLNPFYVEYSCENVTTQDLYCIELDNKYLYPGESIGKRPSWLSENFVLLAILILLLAAGFNQIMKEKVLRDII